VARGTDPITELPDTASMHNLRNLIARAAVTIGAAIAATMVAPSTAHAAISSSVENIVSQTSCHTGTRTAYMNGNLMLNQSRFPNGAYVSNRYRYYWVNTSGARTTPIYSTAWSAARFTDTSRTVYDSVGQPMTMNDPTPMPGATVSGTGKVHVIIDVAVWNGAAYEYTSVRPNTYQTYYPSNYGGTWAQNSFCQLSW
jgi:hypothetical protein